MKRSFSLLIVAYAVADEADRKEAAQNPKDSFCNSIDPDEDCRIEQRQKAVMIEVPRAHHDLTHTDNYTKLNAPRVLKQLGADFFST